MTRFFDLVTGNNLKRWFQRDNLLRSQVVQATTQTSASRAKTARPIKGQKSRVAGERRVKNIQRREIHRTINARDVLLYVDLVMYMSISEVLVKTCWSNATTAKISNLRNFCQFFAGQKWEVNKIGSSATRPLNSFFFNFGNFVVLIGTRYLNYSTFFSYCMLSIRAGSH